jgi:exodeoxyribonuclease V alpha subunit
MAAKLMEITAILKEIRWPPNTDTFFIAKLSPVNQNDIDAFGKMFTAVGNGTEEELKTLLTYRWFGRWAENDRFGPQFKLDTWTPAKPHGKAGVVKYLTNAPHIGEATAIQLWNEFQGEAVRIAREHPEIIAEKVKRLTLDKAKEVAEYLDEQRALEDTSIDLIETLAGRGFPKGTTREAMRVWGARAPAVINADPYKLMRFRGCVFGKCDKMYLDLGLPPGRMKRQVCCSWHAIATERDGHVWLPISKAVEGLKEKIAGVELEPDKAIAIAKRFGALSTMRDCFHCRRTGTIRRINLFTGDEMLAACPKCNGTGGREWIAETKRTDSERRVIERVADMIGWERHWPSIDGPEFATLTEHQREELRKATTGAIGAFCGSPGAGKTWSTAALVRAIVKRHGQHSIAICCPTGKAAQRAKEAMRAHGVNVEATTVHRMLGVEQADDGGGWTFAHNEGNTLPFQFVIGDEWSMCGLGLMSSVLRAFARGTNFLMVGDINQLLPVEYGAPLRDLIDVVPYGELKEIHRNAGSVVKACAAIRDGREIMFDQKMEIDRTDENGEKLPPKNLVIYPADAANAQRKLIELVKTIAADKGRFPGFDPIRDIQVLVAVNKRSDLSRRTLGPILQNILNPRGQGVNGSPFRVGDKVMQTKNAFLKLKDSFSDGPESKVLVCNGEFGIVKEVSATKTVVEFPNPSRVVLIPKFKSDDTDKQNGKGKKEDDASEEGDGTGCDLVLGYATTVWKMQGSSAPIIVGVIDEYAGATGPYGNCDRAFAYTMISRVEREGHLIGQRATLKTVCKRVFIAKRKTFTKELLLEELANRGTSGGVVEPGNVDVTVNETKAEAETLDEVAS